MGGLDRQKANLSAKRYLQKSVQLTDKIRDYVNPDLQSSLDGQDPTSVNGLSPNSPGIKILAKVAVDNGVPFHSVIGNQGMPGPVEKTSDGVVLYNSSHLEGAQSEYIVPANHSAHTHPLAVKEIERILYLHLHELLKEAKQSSAATKK